LAVPQATFDEYVELETSLSAVYREMLQVRANAPSEARDTRIGQLMTEAMAVLLPKMSRLRGIHPELAARILPERVRSPLEIAMGNSLAMAEKRIKEILDEKLWVRIEPSLNPDTPWDVEDVVMPNYVLASFRTKKEARTFVKENALLLA